MKKENLDYLAPTAYSENKRIRDKTSRNPPNDFG